MAAETHEPPAPRVRRKTSQEEVDAAALGPARIAPMPTTPPENVPGRRTIDTYVETLVCRLTRVEIETKRQEAMSALDELDTINAEFDKVKQAFKMKIAAAEARLGSARRIAASGLEEREVRVSAELTMDGMVEFYRTDTWEKIRERRASKEEAQEAMKFG